MPAQAQDWSTAQQPPEGWSAPQTPLQGPHPEARIGAEPGFFERAFPATKPRQDAAIVSTPIGSIEPWHVLSGAMAARGVARAVSGAGTGMAAKALAAVKQLGIEAAPALKYEVAKQTLEYFRVPTPLAIPIALAVSGYRGNGKKPVPAGEVPTTAADATATAAKVETPIELTRRVKAEYRAANSRPGSASVGTPPGADPPPSPVPAAPPRNALPDQRALNEEALARRRSEYQARQAATTAPTTQAPKPTLTADETKVYLELRAKNLTDAEARDLIQASRGIAGLGGTMTPEQVAAEIAARKGNRSPTR